MRFASSWSPNCRGWLSLNAKIQAFICSNSSAGTTHDVDLEDTGERTDPSLPSQFDGVVGGTLRTTKWSIMAMNNSGCQLTSLPPANWTANREVIPSQEVKGNLESGVIVQLVLEFAWCWHVDGVSCLIEGCYNVKTKVGVATGALPHKGACSALMVHTAIWFDVMVEASGGVEATRRTIICVAWYTKMIFDFDFEAQTTACNTDALTSSGCSKIRNLSLASGWNGQTRQANEPGCWQHDSQPRGLRPMHRMPGTSDRSSVCGWCIRRMLMCSSCTSPYRARTAIAHSRGNPPHTFQSLLIVYCSRHTFELTHSWSRWIQAPSLSQSSWSYVLFSRVAFTASSAALEVNDTVLSGLDSLLQHSTSVLLLCHLVFLIQLFSTRPFSSRLFSTRRWRIVPPVFYPRFDPLTLPERCMCSHWETKERFGFFKICSDTNRYGWTWQCSQRDPWLVLDRSPWWLDTVSMSIQEWAWTTYPECALVLLLCKMIVPTG